MSVGGLCCGGKAAEGSPDCFAGKAPPYEVDPVTGEMPECSVERIPKTMEENGWERAAKLMQRWFSGLACDVKEITTPDTTTLDMEWLLGFRRGQDAYEDLIDPDYLTTENATNVLIKKSKERLIEVVGIPVGGQVALTNASGVIAIKEAHFQTIVSSTGYDYDYYYSYALTDLDAALGEFALHATAIGRIERVGESQYVTTVEQVAVTMQDQYDFVGDQLLGFWDFDKHEVERLGRGCLVTNASFREWRERTGQGRDFYVYAGPKVVDVEPISIPFEYTLEVPV